MHIQSYWLTELELNSIDRVHARLIRCASMNVDISVLIADFESLGQLHVC